MCGIVGYIGETSAKSYLVTGLQRMEYRGYDSAGIATIEGQGMKLSRVKGKVAELQKTTLHKHKTGTVGIGHTRWATHGKPSVLNAHPHVAGRVAVVHNGIIENYEALRTSLKKRGVQFSSETDSEVLAWLIDQHYTHSLEQAVRLALSQVEGAYGLAVIARGSEELIVAKRSSPIVIGVSDKATYVASDASALAGYVNEVMYLDDDQIAVCGPGSVTVKTRAGVRRTVPPVPLAMDVASLQKQGHAHFLIKEILEQPAAVRAVLRGRFNTNKTTSVLGGLNVTSRQLRDVQQLVIVGCGTAYYAGLFAKYLIERLAHIPVSVEVASEFRYRQAALPARTIGLAISQSGETADTLAAIDELKRRSVPVLGLVNVVGSSIARAVDGGVYLHAGPEISVASTKAFTTQVVAALLVGLQLTAHKKIALAQRKELIQALQKLPEEIEQALELNELIARRAEQWKDYQSAFYLGRDTLYPIALEGSHKLKEISYIHAEAYAAGEMKHGANALLDDSLLTVFLLAEGELYEKSLSNLAEVQARGSKTLVVTNSAAFARQHEDALYVPASSAWTSPLVLNVALQLVAYHVARARHCAIDQPRNLAKSVTVE